MKNTIAGILLLLLIEYVLISIGSGCAQIGAPTGGPKDTIAPKLIKALPDNNSVNFKGDKIVLLFDEYIDLQNVQSNLLVTPFPKNLPAIQSNLRTISIRLKDSLLPNTTYSINLGDAVKDVNEGNVFNNLVYTFSTGNFIDSLELTGKVLMAETGRIDSTLMVCLYKNASDSDVVKRKPDYITRLNSEGKFKFNFLPAALFKIYALKDGDGSKTYNSGTEAFAFIDKEISTTDKNISLLLFAYNEKKQVNTGSPTASGKKQKEKKLRYTTTLVQQQQDVLQPMELNFNMPVKNFNADKIILTDTFYKPVGAKVSIDSSREKISINYSWKQDQKLMLILSNDALTDENGNNLPQSDTIRFKCKTKEDYGTVLLIFDKTDLSKNPMIFFVEADQVKHQAYLTGREWNNTLFPPGEYEIRILFDENKNGKWDPGNYSLKIQPEKVYSFPQKMTVKSNWENEREMVWPNNY
ncbi:MAG: hypothetical protein FGM46_00480 [Ferruginibacter sp.]|nr:hypothetical protein [Ferruginibacter sp.]